MPCTFVTIRIHHEHLDPYNIEGKLTPSPHQRAAPQPYRPGRIGHRFYYSLLLAPVSAYVPHITTRPQTHTLTYTRRKDPYTCTPFHHIHIWYSSVDFWSALWNCGAWILVFLWIILDLFDLW